MSRLNQYLEEVNFEEEFFNKGKFAESGLTEEDFDPEEIKLGMEVEKEHSPNLRIRKKITLDHLCDNKTYYSDGKAKGIFDELK